MGRKKLYHERMVAALPKGTFKRIDSVLGKHEDRTEFVRKAIDWELWRRVEESKHAPHPYVTPAGV